VAWVKTSRFYSFSRYRIVDKGLWTCTSRIVLQLSVVRFSLLWSFVHCCCKCSSLFLTHFLSSPLDCLSTDDGFWYIPLKFHVLFHYPAIQKQFSIRFYFYISDDIHLPYRKSVSTIKNFKLIYLIPVLKGSTNYSSYLLDAYRKRECVCVCVCMCVCVCIYIYTHTHTHMSISVCVFFWGVKRAAGAGFPFILPFVMQVYPVLHRFRLLVLQKVFTKIYPVNLFVPLI